MPLNIAPLLPTVVEEFASKSRQGENHLGSDRSIRTDSNSF